MKHTRRRRPQKRRHRWLISALRTAHSRTRPAQHPGRSWNRTWFRDQNLPTQTARTSTGSSSSSTASYSGYCAFPSRRALIARLQPCPPTTAQGLSLVYKARYRWRLGVAYEQHPSRSSARRPPAVHADEIRRRESVFSGTRLLSMNEPNGRGELARHTSDITRKPLDKLSAVPSPHRRRARSVRP